MSDSTGPAPALDHPGAGHASPTDPAAAATGGRADLPPTSLPSVLRDQRKVIGVGLVLMAASYWVLGQLGEWETATLTAAGVLLGLVNQVATELWLARLLRSGQEVTRARITSSTIIRLGLLSVVAVGAAVVFWPFGVGLLLGLAIFRLIALVMTTIPLLKELKAQ